MKIHEKIKDGTYEPRTISVYDIDGKTVIDTFTEQTGGMEDFVLNEDGTYTYTGE